MEKRKATHPRFIAVDLFCGAGGTTRGLISAGGEVLAGIDKDSRCAETYEKNNKNRQGNRRAKFLSFDLFPATRNYPGGQQAKALRQVSKMVRLARQKHPGVPLLLAICAPCQPFTRLARQKVSKQRYQQHIRDRSLLLQSLAFVKQLRPQLVFSENVAAIASSKYGDVWRQFQSSLQRLGYNADAEVVNAVDFGIPQYRKRSIIVAVRSTRTSKSKSRRGVTHKVTIPLRDPRAKSMTVKEAIGHLPALKAGQKHKRILNHVTRGLSPLNLQRLARAVPGESNAYMERGKRKPLSLLCHRRVNRRIGQRCFTDVYTRMHPDRPAPTITTRCLSISNGRFGHFDSNQIRAISMREAALLQSFPNSYVFYPVDEIEPAARMIGNAVPPKLASFFARHLLAITKPR